MSDTQTVEQTEVVEPGTTEEQVAAVEGMEVAEAKPARTPKAPKEPVTCACASLLLRDPEDKDALFTTECDAKTKSQFAQGHDARAVSFLVSGQFDGYAILREVGGEVLQYEDAPHAAFSLSDALGRKAQNAVANAQAKLDAKIVRDQGREAARTQRLADAQIKAEAKDKAKEEAKAAKATQPKATGAKVVEGSQEGDAPRSVGPIDVNAPVATQHEDGTFTVLIKVGRHTTEGSLSADKSTVTYLDKDGAEQTREFDTVRCLSRFV